MSRTFVLFSSITTSRRPGPGARVFRWYLYIFYLIYDLYRGLYRDGYSKSSEIAGSRAGAPGQGGRVTHFEMFWASVLVGMMAGWLAGIVMKGGGYGLLWDIIVGLSGSIVGSGLFQALGAPEAGWGCSRIRPGFSSLSARMSSGGLACFRG